MPATEATPLVSVIIPNYNHGQYIGEAIESVLAQTHTRCEVIVVDNFSTDASWSVITSYAARGVKAVRFNNGGVIAAGRNRGLALASGDLIAFLDADDLWKPEKLERQLSHFSDPAVMLVAATPQCVGDVMYFRRRPGGDPQSYDDIEYATLILENPVATSSVVLRADVLRRLGGFDESRDFCFIEDWELWLRVSRVGRVRVLAELLIDYRLEVNKDRDTRDVKRRKLRVIEKHRGLGFVDDSLYRRAVGSIMVEIGRACLGADDWAGLRYYAKGFVRTAGRRRATAFVGLLLFAVPRRLRRMLMDGLYRVQYTAVGLRSR